MAKFSLALEVNAILLCAGYFGILLHDHCPCSITNLKYWGRSEPIINKTLQLLSDLSVGYSSVRKLVKLDAVQFVLHNHTVRNTPYAARITLYDRYAARLTR